MSTKEDAIPSESTRSPRRKRHGGVEHSPSPACAHKAMLTRSDTDSDMMEDPEKNFSECEDAVSVEPNLKMRDGIVLMPQPSDDPNDPLNWSWLSKHAATFTISYLALICYVAVTTLVTGTVPLAQSLHVSKSTAVYLGNTPVALYGVAPWLWSPLSHFIGRRPVLLMCNIIAIVGAVVVTTSKTYASCMVGRVILGAGGSAFWTLGPASIGDIVTISLHRDIPATLMSLRKELTMSCRSSSSTRRARRLVCRPWPL